MLQANAPQPVRILLLDDDRILVQSLAAFLADEGYAVQDASDAKSALERLEEGEFELFIVEVNAAGARPGEFLREVRRRAPHVVTIVVTSYGSIEGAVEATKSGAFDYLTKPIVDDEIRVVVEKAARQQALIYENQSLKQRLESRFGLDNVLGRDHRMAKVFDLVDAVADGRTTVLMLGESGTGKSLIARAIHQRSPRRDKPFIEVSCGALPETLLEAELFGHAPGAFTGAVGEKPGRFLAADGGTIFLDEINSASPAMQVKLLRVLQEKSFEPLGSSQTRTVDARVILASNVDLADLVSEGKFRRDLYYRINVVAIRLPPLRDRAGDVPLLANHFLRKFAQELGRPLLGFTDAALAALRRHDWPGNVRELEHAVERAAVLCRRPQVDMEDLPEAVQPAEDRSVSSRWTELNDAAPVALHAALEGPERRIIVAALERNAWNRQATAAELDINRTTLYKKMRKYGLDDGLSS